MLYPSATMSAKSLGTLPVIYAVDEQQNPLPLEMDIDFKSWILNCIDSLGGIPVIHSNYNRILYLVLELCRTFPVYRF